MKRGLLVGVSFVLGLVACGSDGSQFPDQGQQPGNAPNGVPNGSALPEIGPTGTNSACVNQVVSAELTPTNLVFMYDKSGSMGDKAEGFDPSLKWTPVNSGMKGFFADPYSSTVRASLQFFPMNDDTIQTTCAFGYATPKVALTMTSDAAFVSTLDTTTPEGGTPTLPALQGAIAYAQQITHDRPTDKTAVVLVTDGEPGFWDATQNAFVPGCANNDVAHVSAAAQASFAGNPSVPVYVVGVGPSLDKLNEIAAAGGTKAAIMVDVADPATTKTQITNALNAIRTQQVSCDFSIPPAPAGQQLDPFAVNVVLTNADGSQKILSYSKTCGDTDGWQYDNPTAPTRITLCSAACGEARASSQGKVSLAFGCKTQVAVQ
jgi:hypothetical protein